MKVSSEISSHMKTFLKELTDKISYPALMNFGTIIWSVWEWSVTSRCILTKTM